MYVLVLWKQPSFKQMSVLSVGSRRSSLSQFQAVGPATANAHTSWDCVEAQRGNDAWQNEDVVDWPHQRSECSSPSSTGKPCDAPSTRAWTSLVPARQANEGRHAKAARPRSHFLVSLTRSYDTTPTGWLKHKNWKTLSVWLYSRSEVTIGGSEQVRFHDVFWMMK